MRRTPVIHPFLFAAFPVLFVFARNIQQFSAGVVVVPLLVLAAAGGVLLAILGVILRSARKAGLIVSLFLVLLFSYGPACRAFPEFRFTFWRVLLEPTKTVFVAWAALMLVGAWFSARTKRDLRQFTRILNVAAAALVAMSLVNIAVYELGARRRTSGAPVPQAAEAAPDAAHLPDVYYIIMDAYGRQDVLRKLYDYDNAAFLDDLERRGFTIAERSSANYVHTGMSLASELNMDYVSELLPEVDPALVDLMPLRALIRRSKVGRFLKERGYTTIAFSSGYAITEVTNADVYLAPGWFADEFRNALLDMTPVWVLFKRLSPAAQHRRKLLHIFEGLGRIAPRHSPKFVFAHILAPHRPFVWGPDGEPVNPVHLNAPSEHETWLDGTTDDYRRYYRGELPTLNRKLIETIDAILAESPCPPIIVLRGDHGPRSLLVRPASPTPEALRERFPILFACHLPGNKPGGFYPDMTPVNTFRIILNHSFGTDFKLLADKNYYGALPRPYELTDVTETLRGGSLLPGGEETPAERKKH